MEPDAPLQHKLEAINRQVCRLQRRLRIQRATGGLIEGGCLGLMVVAVGLTAIRTGYFDGTLGVWLAAASLIAAIAAVVRGFRAVDPVEAARQYDTSHGLHDRLSSAMYFTTRGPDTGLDDPFVRAQSADAADFVDELELSRAAPWRAPADATLFAIATAAVALLAVVPMPQHDQPLQESFAVEHPPAVNDATIAYERHRLEQLRDRTDDDDSAQLLDDIEALLDAAEQREISPQQFVERLEELREASERDGYIDDLADALADAAGQSAANVPDTPGEFDDFDTARAALEEGDFSRAADHLERLADQLDEQPPSEEATQQLADALDDLGDRIDQQRGAADEDHQETTDGDDEDLLDDDTEPTSGEQTGDQDAPSPQDRTLEQLSRQFSDAADDLRDDSPEQPPPPQEEQPGQSDQDDSQQPQQPPPGADDDHSDQQQQPPPHPLGQQQDDGPDYRDNTSQRLSDAADQLRETEEQQRQQQQQQQAREQLERMRQSAARGGDEDPQRREKMEDYLDRAGGQQDQQHADGDPSGEPTEQADDDLLDDSDGDGEASGADGDQPGEQADFDYEDHRLEGIDTGEGRSYSEIIQGAAEEGFATTDYEDVYVEYEDFAEEVIEREQIPDGYRYHIERYFELIQPQR